MLFRSEGAARVLSAYPPRTVRAFFARIGLETVEEDEGRVYPASLQAASVLDALRLAIPHYGGTLRTGARVVDIRPAKRGGFSITLEDGTALNAEKTLIAAGGLAAPKLGGCADGARLLEALGHTSTPRFSSIAALKTDSRLTRSVKGQRLRGTIAVTVDGETARAESGEILFGEDALSGIASMQLARCCQEALRRGRKPVAYIRAADMDFNRFALRASTLEDYPLENLLTGLVPKRIGMELVKRAGLDLHASVSSLTRKALKTLWTTVSDWTFPIVGVAGYEQAQVMAGGVRLDEFRLETMESRRVPGLYAAGEVLDVDGDCGGYNLQWAWASGLVAANGMHNA